jgi:hypothetical protein
MLSHRLGTSRHPIEFSCLEEQIGSDNLVRVAAFHRASRLRPLNNGFIRSAPTAPFRRFR